MERLWAILRDGQRLLVLDNLEHLLPAATLLGQLLGACPGLDVLVTSQTVLRLSFEHVYSLHPLPVPGPARRPLPEDVLQFDSARLFVQRARAAWAGFELNAANAPAVAAIRRPPGWPAPGPGAGGAPGCGPSLQRPWTSSWPGTGSPS